MRYWFIILKGLLVLAHSTQPFKTKLNIYLSPTNHAKSKTNHHIQVEQDENQSNNDFILSSIETEPKYKKKSNRDRHIGEAKSGNHHIDANLRHDDLTQEIKTEFTTESDFTSKHSTNKPDKPEGISKYDKTDNKGEDGKDVFEYYDKITNHNDNNRTKVNNNNLSNIPHVGEISNSTTEHKLAQPESAETFLLVHKDPVTSATSPVPLTGYDWTVWCKLQPNGYDCDNSGLVVTDFYYDLKLDACREFDFGGCLDNINKFRRRRDCTITCEDSISMVKLDYLNNFGSIGSLSGGEHVIKAAVQELPEGNIARDVACRMQADFGQCHDYYPMFYFDVSQRACKGFSYSGCGGNANKFKTIEECIDFCGRILSYDPINVTKT